MERLVKVRRLNVWLWRKTSQERQVLKLEGWTVGMGVLLNGRNSGEIQVMRVFQDTRVGVEELRSQLSSTIFNFCVKCVMGLRFVFPLFSAFYLLLFAFWLL